MDFDNVLYSISNSVETKLELGFEINKLLELKDLFRFCKNTAFCLVGPSENEDDEKLPFITIIIIIMVIVTTTILTIIISPK